MLTVRGRTLLALMAVAGTSLLASCSAPAPTVESSSGRLIAVAQPTDAGEDALARGTLEWGKGGCMVMNNGGAVHLIVFPHGTELDDNGEVVLPDGYRLKAGDDTELGGGIHPADMERAELAQLPEKCLTEQVWWASGDHPDGSAKVEEPPPAGSTGPAP
jgi:hypothetical protein